jgi:hypothetical protein
MLGPNTSAAGKVVLAFAALLLGAGSAMAYVGPGVDVSLISQFMTLLWLAGAAGLAVLMWPVYALLRWLRGRRSETSVERRLADADEPS